MKTPSIKTLSKICSLIVLFGTILTFTLYFFYGDEGRIYRLPVIFYSLGIFTAAWFSKETDNVSIIKTAVMISSFLPFTPHIIFLMHHGFNLNEMFINFKFAQWPLTLIMFLIPNVIYIYKRSKATIIVHG